MAAGSTYTPIATQTISGSPTSVTFSSIPGTYTDLMVVTQTAFTAGTDLYYRFNGDTGSNYSNTILFGTGSTAGSARNSSATAGILDYYGNPITTVGDSMMYMNIFNYANTTTYKTSLSRSSRGTSSGGGTDAIVNLWRSTAAITSITFGGGSGLSQTWVNGSVISLYGIAAA